MDMDLVIKNAEKHAVQKVDDYRNGEGLLICGCCHTAKQVRISFQGEKIVPCSCECEIRRYEEERAALRAMRDGILVEQMRREAFQNGGLHTHTFAKDDGGNPEIRKMAELYVQRFEEICKENAGLLLYGEPGTGKSFYAACIVNALIDKKISAFMTNVTELTRLCDPGERAEMLRKIAHCELVVMDDIDSERGTEYALEQIYGAIDTRYRSKKPLIVTTNYSPRELMESTNLDHRRIYDRIQEICTPIEVKGTRRKGIGRDRAAVLAGILYGHEKTSPEQPEKPGK